MATLEIKVLSTGKRLTLSMLRLCFSSGIDVVTSRGPRPRKTAVLTGMVVFLFWGGYVGKPFLTVEEQIELLERRGVSRTEGERCALMREGYYSIINGYKEPFLEPVVTKDDLSDRYKGGTSFDDIFALFTFDRSL